MFVTNWISTTKIQKISEITNFFRHYFLSRTEVIFFIIVILLALILHFVFNNANNDIEPKKILEYYEFANL